MYQPVIGLEIHVELKTKSKMFCSCLNNSDEKVPNVNICPICMGHPGTLPTINKEAVKKTVKTGLALNCQVLNYSKFDRKNYFYPDLPKGYQISQYDMPLCRNGFLEIPAVGETAEVKNSELKASAFAKASAGRQNLKLQPKTQKFKKIRIRRVHLEEDTGRLIHSERGNYSLVDFNRAGVPLMELVTEPDLNSAEQARKFAEELQLILRYLGISDADMEKGQLRVEVNISLQKVPKQAQSKARNTLKKGLGVKVEIKNLNSFKAVEKAVEYEIERQTKILKLGKKVIQETRGWDVVKGVTVSQREKEEAHDYRYFPEPDLPPLHFTPVQLQKIKAEIPELPLARRKRFGIEYNLSDKEIDIFVNYKELGEYFEKVISELKDWVKSVEFKTKISKPEENKLIKLAVNYILTDFLGLLKGRMFTQKDCLITPENFAEFITLIYKGEISSKIAKIVLEEMFKKGADPSQIIKEKGLVQLTDEKEIEKIIKQIILKNQKAVQDYKKGKQNAFQFLIGQAMSATKGKANPSIVNKILQRILE